MLHKCKGCKKMGKYCCGICAHKAGWNCKRYEYKIETCAHCQKRAERNKEKLEKHKERMEKRKEKLEKIKEGKKGKEGKKEKDNPILPADPKGGND